MGDDASLTEAEEKEDDFFNDLRNLINILHTHSEGETESAREVKDILTQNEFPQTVWDRRNGTWTDYAFANPIWETEQIWRSIYNVGSDELKRLLRIDPYNRLIVHLVGHDPFIESTLPPELPSIETPPQTPRQRPPQGYQTPSSLTNSMGAPSSNESFRSASPDTPPRIPAIDELIRIPRPPNSPHSGGRKIKTKKQRKSKSKKYRKILDKRRTRRYKNDSFMTNIKMVLKENIMGWLFSQSVGDYPKLNIHRKETL
jgi:hypothetical protein